MEDLRSCKPHLVSLLGVSFQKNLAGFTIFVQTKLDEKMICFLLLWGFMWKTKKKLVAKYCSIVNLNGLVDKHYFLFLFFLQYTAKHKIRFILYYIRHNVCINAYLLVKKHINIVFTWVILFLISLFSSCLFFPVYFIILYEGGIQIHTP